LERELAISYTQQPWRSGWINRLARDLADTMEAIAAMQAQAEAQRSLSAAAGSSRRSTARSAAAISAEAIGSAMSRQEARHARG
jgi:hypothetical protein